MFLSRLDRARQEQDEPHIIHGKKVNERSERKSEGKEENESKPTDSAKKKSSRILHELNEYLFDLFDANCMEDFHKMDKFEQEAVKLFDSEEFISNANYEFSHEQYGKHQEFLRLFESLVENFLLSYHYTPEMLYEEIEKYSKQKEAAKKAQPKTPSPEPLSKEKKSPSQWSFDGYESEESNDESNALEIVEVIGYYTSFEKWCDMMRENVKLKRYFRSFQDKILSAASDMKEK